MTLQKNRVIEFNAAQCRKCGKIMISNNPDMVAYCSCGSVWIGGGRERLLRGGELSFLNEMAVWTRRAE